MMTPPRIVRLIGIMGLVGWLGVVGWMARTSQAQNGGQAAAAARPGPRTELAGKGSPPPPPLAPAAASEPGNAAALSLPKDQGALAPPAIEPVPEAIAKAPSTPEPVARAQAAASPDVSPPGNEDPEKSAQSFVERSQKEAEEHLKTLTAEAEQLRTRLAKLDSGIKKWQNLLTALKAAQQGQPLAAAEEPVNLEPVSPGTPGPRGDKRVERASATAGAAVSSPQPGQANEPAAATPAPLPAVNQPAAAPVQAVAPAAPR